MLQQIRATVYLVVTTMLISSVAYPLLLLGVGQALFRDRAEGSLLRDKDGKVIGSRLIAQPFTGDEYFQPRPSAASYNAAASAGSNWGANNYLLRDRVARILGPVVKYGGGPKKGQPVAPDVESWFQTKKFKGDDGKEVGVVAQWAADHGTLAANWAKDASNDSANGKFVMAWARAHPKDVDEWKKQHPDTPEPKPEDLAGIFFQSFSETFPGTFPSLVDHKLPDGKTEKQMEPVKEGSDVQSIFFDMWRQDHPDADLEPAPADMVTASGSGLDPHITLQNAEYQLDRVAQKWARKLLGEPDEDELKKDDAKWKEYEGKVNATAARVAKETRELVRSRAEAVMGGAIRAPIVNVLETNVALRDRYEPQLPKK